MLSSIDQPCYTLINSSTDFEVPSEVQLRHDLGE